MILVYLRFTSLSNSYLNIHFVVYLINWMILIIGYKYTKSYEIVFPIWFGSWQYLPSRRCTYTKFICRIIVKRANTSSIIVPERTLHVQNQFHLWSWEIKRNWCDSNKYLKIFKICVIDFFVGLVVVVGFVPLFVFLWWTHLNFLWLYIFWIGCKRIHLCLSQH